MGWLTVVRYLEEIDQRKPGGTFALRHYLGGESDPTRSLRVATVQFIKMHGRSPRYAPSPWRSSSRRKATS